MSSIALVILIVAVLFTLLLIVKSRVKNFSFCAICVAVSLTWISLLFLYWVDIFDNQIVLGILMGQTSLGVYYLLEKKAQKRMLVFRLPVLTSLILVMFSLLTLSLHLDALIIVIGLWVIVGVLYVYRSHSAFKNKVQALIECCSNW